MDLLYGSFICAVGVSIEIQSLYYSSVRLLSQIDFCCTLHGAYRALVLLVHKATIDVRILREITHSYSHWGLLVQVTMDWFRYWHR